MALSTGNLYLDALGGSAWPKSGDNVIPTVYFDQDTSAGHSTGGAWTTDENLAFWNAIHAWTNVANIHILEVQPLPGETIDPDVVDIWLRKQTSAELGATILGRTDYPDTAGENVSAYNVNLFWTAAAMQPGGYTMETFIHELGHAIGLAHPHDLDMGTGRFPGVDGLDASGNPFDFDGDGSLFEADGTTRDAGDFANDRGANSLNAIPYTIMSYNEATGSNQNTAADRGFASTPLAFDIAAIQAMYGAVAFKDGDTVYTLVDDGPGTSYSCIWDTSGTDTIQYNGSNGTTIDLRAATLSNAVGGGGFLSQVNGVRGGFTIAADYTDFDKNGNFGVLIENAIGGSGVDRITGNEIANRLEGRDGADTLTGGGAHDTLIGGAGSDTYVLNDVTAVGYDAVVEDPGGGDADQINVSAQPGFTSYTLGANIENGAVIGLDAFDLVGNDLSNWLTGNDAVNALLGGAGQDTLLSHGGDDSLAGGLDDDWLNGGDNSDTAFFDGSKTDFVITGTATDLTIADRTAGRYGTDRVFNVETFVFAGVTYTAEEIANAAPIITSNGGGALAAVDVAENTYFVTKVVATDADADPLTFALSGADAALFQVAANGDITFRAAPDFEAPVGGDNVYDLAVTVTDTSFATDIQAITVTVTDVVEIVDTDTVALLSGTAGADTITPGAGQDTVLAGDGNDVIKATINDGKDVYNGGNGSDTVDYSALTAGVTVKLGQNGGPGSGFGIQAGEDKLISIENAIGSAAADQITGNEVGNVLEGGRGNDLMTGLGGNDSYNFRSGFGLDRIFDFDDAGDDTIVFSTAVFADWTAVQNAMNTSGADVVITLDAANSITLLGTTLASMTQTDFLFVA